MYGGRGWPGRLRVDSRLVLCGGLFLLLLSAVAVVGCALSAVFVLCMPFGEEKGSIVNKVPISLNCLPGPSSPGEEGG